MVERVVESVSGGRIGRRELWEGSGVEGVVEDIVAATEESVMMNYRWGLCGKVKVGRCDR